jgi:hypothetical protein
MARSYQHVPSPHLSKNDKQDTNAVYASLVEFSGRFPQTRQHQEFKTVQSTTKVRGRPTIVSAQAVKPSSQFVQLLANATTVAWQNSESPPTE